MTVPVTAKSFDAELWLATFGLRSDPFRVASDTFIAVLQRNENLSNLQHLALFSSRILVVSGEAGSGKSALLEEWLKRQDGSLFLAIVQAGSRDEKNSLLQRLAGAIGLAEPSGSALEIAKASILEACEKRYENGIKTVVAVDNADQLAAGDLQWLAETFAARDNAAVALVLVGLPSLQTLVCQALPEHKEQHLLSRIELKPLLKSEVRLYLQARLKEAGWNGSPKLTDAMVAAIAGASKGNPARIHAVAPGIILEKAREATSDNKARWPFPPQLMAAILAGIMLFVLLVTGWLYYPKSGYIEPLPALSQGLVGETVTLDLGMPFLQAEAPDPALLPPAPEISSATVADALAEEQMPMPLLESVPALEPVPLAESVAPALQIAASVPAPEPAGLPSPPAATATATAPSAKPARAEPAMKTAVMPVALRSQAWMNEQPGKAWTVQMLGTVEMEAAVDYVKNWNIKGFEPFYFESVYKGKPWYIVLLGIYKSKDDARKAMDSLPAVIRQQGSWLRSVAGLKTGS